MQYQRGYTGRLKKPTFITTESGTKGFFFDVPGTNITAVQLVFNPFSQFVPQLEVYSQFQLSLWSDPIAFSVPKSTWWFLVMI